MAQKIKISGFLRSYEGHAVTTNGKAASRPPASQYGYVMGGDGRTATDDYIRARAKSSYGDKWESYYEDYKKWVGHRVFDCNSLSEVYYREQTGASIDTKARYNYANWCSRKSCTKKDTTLAGLPQLPGVALFSGPSAAGITHVGYLWKKTGSGPLDWQVLEARGKDYGVVITDLKQRQWGWWGVMDKYFEYDLAADGPAEPTGAPENAAKPFNGKCSGNSVYFREGPGKGHKALGIVRKGEEILALPAADRWCEAATVIKGRIVKGFISSKYVKADATDTASTRAYPATCSGQDVNIRTGRSTEHSSIGTLNKGDLLIAMPREAGWCNAAAVIEGHIAVGYVFCLYVKSR